MKLCHNFRKEDLPHLQIRWVAPLDTPVINQAITLKKIAKLPVFSFSSNHKYACAFKFIGVHLSPF